MAKNKKVGIFTVLAMAGTVGNIITNAQQGGEIDALAGIEAIEQLAAAAGVKTNADSFNTARAIASAVTGAKKSRRLAALNVLDLGQKLCRRLDIEWDMTGVKIV